MKINFYKCNFFKKRLLIKVFKECLNTLLQPDNVEFSLSFVSDMQIKELNNKYRNIDSSTDVLSFPSLNLSVGDIVNSSNAKTSINYDNGNYLLGDIIICNEKVKTQAGEYGHSYNRELSFLALHGLLHLLGYDHQDEAGDKQMNEISEVILNKLGLKKV